MKVIIAGTRDIDKLRIVPTVEDIDKAVRASSYYVTSVTCGCARGIDLLGEAWAVARGIPVEYFPVPDWQWKEDPSGAGKKRNARMAHHSHALVALWDGKSGGTRHMITVARSLRLLVYVHRIGGT